MKRDTSTTRQGLKNLDGPSRNRRRRTVHQDCWHDFREHRDRITDEWFMKCVKCGKRGETPPLW